MTDKFIKFIPKFLVSFFFMIIIFGAYIKIWEWRQDKFELINVTIVKILPYHSSGGDLQRSFRGFRIYIVEDKRKIDFPYKYWKRDIKIGESVDIIARKSFFSGELDGLAIKKVSRNY